VRRLDRATTGFLILAALLLVAQFVSAFFVHVTVRAEPTGAGWAVPPTKTYMQAFGASEVILTLLSLAALLVVGSVLVRRSGRGALGAGALAWGVSAAAAALGLVGFVYLFGVGVCLLVACATVPRRPSTAAPRRRSSVASSVTG
jgi:CBS domain containing-hemolysin-like protein